MYDLKVLRDSTALKYKEYTFPAFHSLLYGDLESDISTVAIAASYHDQPIGLVLASIRQNDSSAEILSIFVKAERRCNGVGTALLKCADEELLRRGCTKIELVYMTGKETTSALEHLLRKCNWEDSSPRMLVCKGKAKVVMGAAWMRRYRKLPSSYEIFPWTEITQEERHAILQKQETKPWIPKDLVPFQYERNLEPINSLGLRYQGQVVGWVINHRLSPDTIRYTCSFVREDLQKMGRIISLYAEAGDRQVTADIPNIIWTVPLEHESMVKFVKYRWAPYLTSIDETRGTFRFLGVETANEKK